MKDWKKKIIKFDRSGELIHDLGDPAKLGRDLFFQMYFFS
jgi:hypothetical protein